MHARLCLESHHLWPDHRLHLLSQSSVHTLPGTTLHCSRSESTPCELCEVCGCGCSVLAHAWSITRHLPMCNKVLPLTYKMANRITAPELEQFVVATVELTGRVIGAGAYGSVEEVEIPGATVAAKKLHQQLVNLGSPQQVDLFLAPLLIFLVST